MLIEERDGGAYNPDDPTDERRWSLRWVRECHWLPAAPGLPTAERIVWGEPLVQLVGPLEPPPVLA